MHELGRLLSRVRNVEDGRVAKDMTRDHPLFKGVLCTTTIDTFKGPDDPAQAWRMAGLEPPR